MFGELKETPFEHFVTHYGQVLVVDVCYLELGENTLWPTLVHYQKKPVYFSAHPFKYLIPHQEKIGSL